MSSIVVNKTFFVRSRLCTSVIVNQFLLGLKPASVSFFTFSQLTSCIRRVQQNSIVYTVTQYHEVNRTLHA